MIAASYNCSVSESYVLRMSLTRPVDSRENLVPAVFDVCRTVRFIQDAYFKFDRPKFLEASAVDAKAFLIN
jgi:hypothetical protein